MYPEGPKFKKPISTLLLVFVNKVKPTETP